MLGFPAPTFDGGFLIYKIMKEEITGFIFYRSFYEAIKKLEDIEDRFVIYQAICEYSFYGTEPILDGLKSIIWTLIKPQIDANIKKRIDAKKGGAPKGNKVLNGGVGYFNAAPMANGMPVAAPLPMGDLSKGPQNTSMGPMGNITKGGNGTGRFTGKNQYKDGTAGADFPNRVPGK